MAEQSQSPIIRPVGGMRHQAKGMEEHVVDRQSDSTASGDKYYFLIRRLHSLTGLVPLGAFLFLHLCANATILAPGDVPGSEFQRSVDSIHALGPLLIPVEIVGIFIPLAFHTLLGFQIMFSGSPNAQQYRYGSNIRFTLQRVTAVIAFFFILYHLWQLHWLGEFFGGGRFHAHDELNNPTAAVTTAIQIQSAPWVALVYAVGVLSVVYHLANGIWTSLITWGITIRPRSQKASGWVCAAIGVVLAVVGLGAIRGFKTFDVDGSAAHSAQHATATDRES